MSEQEATETKRYEVLLSIDGTLYVELEAEDEDEAHDEAMKLWSMSTSDIDFHRTHVDEISELA